MQTSVVTADHPCGLGDPTADTLQVQLRRMLEAKSALEHELSHCQEQLNLMFLVTEQISNQRDPECIRGMLLTHYAAMLRTATLFMDRAGCCTRISAPPPAGTAMTAPPGLVRAALARQIESVRDGRRALVIEHCADLAGAHVLLGALTLADADVGVVVALRAPPEPAFDPSDVLASESMLVYGAQALRSAAMVRNLQRSALETVCALVNAIDAKDNYTSDHSERVGGLARLTGEALDLSRERLQALEWAGLLHDVGKIGIPEQILNKPGRLTESEFEQMKQHPRIGHDMLRPVARFEPVLGAVLHHHENEDGSGYPDGLRGDEIPLEAQIIHVADVFDALTTSRPYRNGYNFEQALRVIEQEAGRVTNTRVTAAFTAALRRYLAVNPSGFRTQFAHLKPEQEPR